MQNIKQKILLVLVLLFGYYVYQSKKVELPVDKDGKPLPVYPNNPLPVTPDKPLCPGPFCPKPKP